MGYHNRTIVYYTILNLIESENTAANLYGRWHTNIYLMKKTST